jgi:hypothetical protein
MIREESVEETEDRQKWLAVFSASRSFFPMRFESDEDFNPLNPKPSNSKGPRVDWQLRSVFQAANGEKPRKSKSPTFLAAGVYSSLFRQFTVDLTNRRPKSDTENCQAKVFKG